MITVRSLTKQYDDAAVVDDVTLDLATAGVTALIGPNGAGKSTLLSVVARLLRPERGAAHVDELDVHRAGSRELATRLAVLRQEHDLAAPIASMTACRPCSGRTITVKSLIRPLSSQAIMSTPCTCKPSTSVVNSSTAESSPSHSRR